MTSVLIVLTVRNIAYEEFDLVPELFLVSNLVLEFFLVPGAKSYFIRFIFLCPYSTLPLVRH